MCRKARLLIAFKWRQQRIKLQRGAEPVLTAFKIGGCDVIWNFRSGLELGSGCEPYISNLRDKSWSSFALNAFYTLSFLF